MSNIKQQFSLTGFLFFYIFQKLNIHLSNFTFFQLMRLSSVFSAFSVFIVVEIFLILSTISLLKSEKVEFWQPSSFNILLPQYNIKLVGAYQKMCNIIDLTISYSVRSIMMLNQHTKNEVKRSSRSRDIPCWRSKQSVKSREFLGQNPRTKFSKDLWFSQKRRRPSKF